MFDWLKEKIGGSLQERMIGTVVRWAVTFGFGVLVTHGWVTKDESTGYINQAAELMVPLAMLIWGLVQKHSDRLKFLAARELPSTATGAQIEAKADSPAIRAKAFS